LWPKHGVRRLAGEKVARSGREYLPTTLSGRWSLNTQFVIGIMTPLQRWGASDANAPFVHAAW
jgi:hypothetical protein